jgi:hypothetical protein
MDSVGFGSNLRPRAKEDRCADGAKATLSAAR